ncbi:MAG TPA: glutaredoxin family protein [Burkholderiaceae bacterium]|nr:glutaredoxin family protein [Burkholderiaceae bacterium]
MHCAAVLLMLPRALALGVALTAMGMVGTISAQTTTTLYKTVGPDGKVSYTDRPDPHAAKSQTLSFNHLPASPLSAETVAYIEQLQKAGQQREAQAALGDVVLFSAPWCGHCKKAKSHLARQQVAYREFNIDTPQGKAAYAQAGGKSGVPFLVARGQHVLGYSASAYDALLGKAR